MAVYKAYLPDLLPDLKDWFRGEMAKLPTLGADERNKMKSYEEVQKENKLALETLYGAEIGGLVAKLVVDACFNEDQAVALAKILLELTRAK